MSAVTHDGIGVGIFLIGFSHCGWAFKMALNFKHGRALLALAVIATICASTSALTEERDQPIVANFVFAMPQVWFLLPSKSTSDNSLIFRRFSVAMHKVDFDDLRSDRTESVKIIGEAGQFYNSMLYFCQRSNMKADFVQFHLPADVTPASFKYDDWVSSLEIRILTNISSMRVRGEYMKGDLFVDADATEQKLFLSLIESSELTVEFGSQNDRLNLFVSDKLMKANLKRLLVTALPIMFNLKNLKHFTNQEMTERCLSYKKTGRF
jgi:hypothetical protein